MRLLSLRLPFRFSKTGRAVLRPVNRCNAIPERAGRHDRASQCDHGADGDRTHDLRLAKPALSQLSYSPAFRPEGMMGPGRVELPTLPLSGVRSSQLSYGPAFPPKGGAGTELDSPASRSLKTR